MDIQAIMISGDVCRGSRFLLNAPQIRTGDVVVLGRLVSGFVTLLQNDRMVIDLRTAVIDCRPVRDTVMTSGLTWEVTNVLAPTDAAFS